MNQRTFSRSTVLLLSAALLVCLSAVSSAQITTGDGPRYPGTTGERFPVDTTGMEQAQIRTEQSTGLLDGPVDENAYIMGPSDELVVSIAAARPLMHQVKVTADGRVVIPSVGAVDVRGMSLSEARRAIDAAVGRVYRVGASVALERVRRFKVHLVGALRNSGTVIATPVTRVSEAIDLAGGTLSRASKRDIVLYRGDQKIHVDLLPFYAFGDVESNPYVLEGDRIHVGFQDPSRVVAIYGAVFNPGEWTFRPGDSISTLIRYSTGFLAEAVRDNIEVVSVSANGDTLASETVRALPDGTVVPDRELRPGDRIFVRSYPNYRATEEIVVAGHVRFPGTYPIQPGRTRLMDVITEFGGFLPDASIPDAQLVRRQIEREPDFEWIRINQIEPEDRTPEEVELYRIKSRERRGVMSIDFPDLMAGSERENVILRDEDSLFVPTKKGTIKLTGKVKNPGNITYYDGYGYLDYIALGGGFGWKADRSDVVITKARTGEKFLASNTDDYVIEPGDELFIPEERPGDFWTGFTTAITVAAQLATLVAVVISISRQ